MTPRDVIERFPLPADVAWITARLRGWSDSCSGQDMSTHVLVIDDDAAIRLVLREALGNEGYRVETAASTAEALEMVDKNAPALIFLDMRMPDDGPRFKRDLRQRADGAPIIGMSASSGAREWATSIGIAFLAKPFDLAEVLAVAKEAAPEAAPAA